MLYAHSLPDHPETDWQTLEAHHAGVSRLAADFAAVWGTPETASLLGKIHDTGKRSDAFQQRLRGRPGRVDHSSAACLYLMRQWGEEARPDADRLLARLLAYPLLGHHGGMPDHGAEAAEGTLAWRLYGARARDVPDWRAEGCAALPPSMTFWRELQALMCLEGRKPDPFAVSFLLRMLYSCLVDADFLDTEAFCAADRAALRPAWPSLAEPAQRFAAAMSERGFLSGPEVTEEHLHAGAATACGSEERRAAIATARRYMLQCCCRAAEAPPGAFSLTMPTGGGKTLSSLAFALRHARAHRLRRIILVVPYTSIIEQNAEVFRQVLGDDAVLEHHSNFLHPEEEREDGDARAALAYKLSTENWDAHVIVTTSVQFFESLFADRPSRCRKLHNVAGSVIILDEVQMLPIPLVQPCVAALRLLTRHYGCSVLLCTATQPALMRSACLADGFREEEISHIIPPAALPPLFRIFQRTRLEQTGVLDDETLARRLSGERQVLCIVNSRRHARELFLLLEESEANLHLSARMTPHHRSRTVRIMRERLAAGLPCRVISTSLIECGVDISFPVVWREKNGLDVLAQSAGRCNREGEAAAGRVYCFTSDKPLPKRAAELARRRQAFDAVAGREDPFAPDSVRDYFQALYAACPSLDEEGILADLRADNPPGRVPEHFRFETTARRFRFIDEQTESVIAERGEAAELIRQVEDGMLSPAILRRLQRHTVQVYPHELELMRRDGRIDSVKGFLHVLRGGQGYNERLGLDVALEQGLPVADLLF